MKKEERSKLRGVEIELLQELNCTYRLQSTFVLIELLRQVRATQSSGQPYGTNAFYSELRPLTSACKRQLEKIVVALKAELATRPHVPNSKERKAIRRMKAQGKF